MNSHGILEGPKAALPSRWFLRLLPSISKSLYLREATPVTVYSVLFLTENTNIATGIYTTASTSKLETSKFNMSRLCGEEQARGLFEVPLVGNVQGRKFAP